MTRRTIRINNSTIEMIHISIELSVDGTVWMTKNEIASLFDVFSSSVEANLKYLFKSNRFRDKEVNKEETQFFSNGQKCIVEYFNLDVIIALCYRIDSYPCIHFRLWVTKQVALSCKKHSPIIVQLGTTTTMN